MKNMRRILTALLGCCLFLCSPISAGATDYSKTKQDQTRWNDIKEKYMDTNTNRLIFVKCKGGTNATVEMWKKVSKTEKPFSDATTDESARICNFFTLFQKQNFHAGLYCSS